MEPNVHEKRDAFERTLAATKDTSMRTMEPTLYRTAPFDGTPTTVAGPKEVKLRMHFEMMSFMSREKTLVLMGAIGYSGGGSGPTVTIALLIQFCPGAVQDGLSEVLRASRYESTTITEMPPLDASKMKFEARECCPQASRRETK